MIEVLLLLQKYSYKLKNESMWTIMYGHRAFLDRAHLSNNWILEFYASYCLESQNLDWDGEKTPNPSIILIQDNNINVFYCRAKNLRNLWESGKRTKF